jgi:hypothetical protein
MKRFQPVFAFAICLVFSCCTPSKPKGSASSASPGSRHEAAELLNANTFKLTEVSTDATYGYSEKNAIQVGGSGSGPVNEQRYLNALLGPNGEHVNYNRLGSCCSVKSAKAVFGNRVPLDKYELTYEGLEKSIILYINMYDYSPLKAPKGFTFRE